MARREFTKAVYAQIVKRAMLPSGEIACEGCGLVMGKKPYHIDHTIPDALQIDKSRKLTADDGKLLGVDCCHAPKTRQQDIPAIAKAKRREAKHLGIPGPVAKINSAPFQKSTKAAQRAEKAASKLPLPKRAVLMFAAPTDTRQA